MPAASGSDENWWRGAVIYQVYPRSFQDTDGDGMGDLRGVTRRLPHIASLGVDAIWLSPFFTSPQADMGYDVSDYCDVDPMFGTLADFDEMLAEAHRLGLKVIIDQVISHTSDRHPWFVESRSSRTNPKADWYVWADPKPDGTAPNNWLSIFGGPGWEWDGVRRQYYLHNFLSSQPDLNFHNPEVQEAVLATVRFWLDRGVDGFRLDTANFYFHDRLLRDNPPLVPDPDATSRDAPEVNPYGMQDHLYDKTQPENLDFLRRFRGCSMNMAAARQWGRSGTGHARCRRLPPIRRRRQAAYVLYLRPARTGIHCAPFPPLRREFPVDGDGRLGLLGLFQYDVMRHVSRFALREADRERVAKLAISLLASLRGTICLYQGEELGLPEAELAFEELRDPYGIRFWPAFAGRDGCRTPMVWERELSNAGFSAGIPWLPVRDGHRMLAVDAQEGVEGAVLEHYRQTLGFRRAQSALVDGDMVFLGTNQDLLVFTREKDDERLLFVFNLTQEPQTFHLPTTLVAEPHPMPGFAPVFADNAIKLAALDVFCGRLR